MRKSYRSDYLFRKQNKIYMGLNFGSDCAAEHEFGIADIRRYFGMKDDKLGIDRRKIHIIPESFKLVDQDGLYGFGLFSWISERYSKRSEAEQLSEWLAFDGRKIKDNERYTAWDSCSFAVLVNSKNEKEKKLIKELYEAVMNKDAAIWLGGGGIFENAGLCIVITSRLPVEKVKEQYEADLNRKNLQDAMTATGIKEILEKAGKRYCALTPMRYEGNKLMFWLNPFEQNIHNYGCFSLDDLKLWAVNKGPIMMSKPKRHW